MFQVNISIPPILGPVWESKARFNTLYGGRGSAKSWTIALLLLTLAGSKKTRILCCREFQTSIKQSVHKLLVDLINDLGLPGFIITHDAIKHENGSEFIFKGLKININNLKSLAKIDICWVEEAQNVSEESWVHLIPSIREKGSRFYITFNPENESDPTYQKFIVKEQKNSLVIKCNYWDNPWFSSELKDAMEYDKKTDYEKYLWIWEGNCKKASDSQVFGGKFIVDNFDSPVDTDFLYGADWGFSTDPTTLIRSWIGTSGFGKTLYIDQELYGHGIETVDLPQFFDKMPGANRNVIRSDSARPEIISHLNKNGYPKVIPARKWSGSVEDGISYLRGFNKIIIHERCKNTIDEFKTYSYKTNKLTGDVKADLEDKNNHCIDALRYAHELLISKPPVPGLRFIEVQNLF